MNRSRRQYPAIPITDEELKAEARQLTRSLEGKKVKKVWRHRSKEVVVQFEDGTTLFVDHRSNGLETSVT